MIDYAPKWTPMNVFLPRVSPKEELTCVVCFRSFLRTGGAIGLLEHQGAEYEALVCWECGGYSGRISMRKVVRAVTGQP